LRNKNYEPEIIIDDKTQSEIFQIKARQIVGQAAAEGITRGKARVVREKEDIFAFKEGEILVVDSIEPNMTFIVPLARGIVERRGGLLVHGAIIAREYEIPCVTGVPNATNLIQTGDLLTVDGYLGIVILQKNF
jgi:pyruvate,water dikinase